MLDTGRVDRAAAALGAMHKEAEQAHHRCRWMFEYLQAAQTSCLSCHNDADGEAELLSGRVSAWKAAQDDMKNSMAWALGYTRDIVDPYRKAWKGRVQGFCDSEVGRDKKAQAVFADTYPVIKGNADVCASMESCFEAMRGRSAGLLRSAQAQWQLLAAITYNLIRLVRRRMLPCYFESACLPRHSGACQGGEIWTPCDSGLSILHA